LAEFRAQYDDIRALAADVAALSVDDAGHSEPVRALYRLQFPILCDPKAEVVKEWGLFKSEEKGGISQSAVFVIDSGLRVLLASLDTTLSRVRADGVVAYLRAAAAGQTAAPPERRLVIPTLKELSDTAFPALKLAFFPPPKR